MNLVVKKKKERKNTYHLQAQAQTHTHTPKKRGKKNYVADTSIHPFIKEMLYNAPDSRSPWDKKTGKNVDEL